MGEQQMNPVVADLLRREGDVPMFMGKPDRWWDFPHWRCPNGHVTTMYLKSEAKGALCLRCRTSVELTSPDDRSDEAPTHAAAQRPRSS